MNTSRRQLPALTGIRFFLAMWVVVYHQSDSLLGPLGAAPWLHRAIEGIVQTGYTAVSAFFVLSGFVLAYNYDLRTLGSGRNGVRFGIARFSRIYPAYVTGLLILIPLAIYRLVAVVEGGMHAGAGNFILSLCLLQAWVPGSALSWNYPGWSLSDEAFFYAMLPFAGVLMARIAEGSSGRRTFRLLGLAAALWLLGLAVPVWAVLHQVPHFGDAQATDIELVGEGAWANAIRYSPVFRLPEFCMGVVLALLYRSIPAKSRLWNSGARFYVPGAAIVLLVLANGDRIPYPVVHNGLLAPAYAMIFFGLALEGGILVRFLSLPAVVFLGNASYSMYILHAPIGAWMSIGFRRLLNVDPYGPAWLICYMTAVIGLAALFFRKAEEPSHRWLRKRLSDWAAGTSAVAVPIISNVTSN